MSTPMAPARTRTATRVTALALAASLLYPTAAMAAVERPAPATPRATSNPPDISQPPEFAVAVQRLIYRMRQDFSERTPIGPHGFTHRLIGRGDSGTRNWGLVGVGHLNYHDADDVQLVIDPDDLYIRGFYRRSTNTLYHFERAGIPDALLPDANRVQLGFAENYRSLADITVSQSSITGAIDNLLFNNNTGTGGDLQGAVELMAVTFAETARNRRIGQEVYNALRSGGEWQVGGHADAITDWNRMGGDIRTALTDNDWDRERRDYLLDGQHGGQRRSYSAAFLLGVTFLIKRR
ncbi:ribosome-inactivating family protein [Streptomyces sp. PmtG]